jgi:hypothetical protein
MSTPRNAACPCGSGKKFKRCCGAVGATPVATEAGPDEGLSRAGWGHRMVPVILFSIAVGAGVGVGTWRNAVADGLAVAFALCLGSIIYLMARNPPEGTGTEGGTAINFGLSSRGKRRGGGPPNRRQRRRK